MKKKELSPAKICRMQKRAILYRRLMRKCEPLIRRARRLVLKTYPLIRRVTHLARRLAWGIKQIPRLMKKLMPRIKRLAGTMWKLLVFLQIPCRLLILILEPLVQRVKRTDWTPCEAS